MSTSNDLPNHSPPATIPKVYSDDLKACIPVLNDGMSLEEICHILGVKHSLVYMTLIWTSL
ncbi:hypothetical protein BS47DRAFT_1336859 [Hydnum rufescens UP504]|uniref:Uncharacterized protein n=1 Tax=Hydnum rufescens UP504 TaxID=1448309 RepID=A0A9P6E1M2_9AGAM|nr:hypothetical protein BS47DRAFT_1336859 [Hydnum rufescens UP504]